MMINKLEIVLTCSLFSLLAGCLIPEKFSASVDIHPDGSYLYKYDGTAVHALAAATIQKKGKLSANDESGLQSEAAKALKSKDVKKITYLGAGKFDVSIEKELKPNQDSSNVLYFISVTKDKNGIITVSPPKLSAQDKKELLSLGIKVDGKMSVTLPANAKVITENATTKPGFFDKAYQWKIGSIEQAPTIQFTLK